jgi:hypothetical protein
MAHPWHHAVRSAKLFGGKVEDYLSVHSWFDESKAHMPDLRHRALRHHSEGIFLCEQVMGTVVRNSDGRSVPVRSIGKQHVKDDLGWIPTVKDWLSNMRIEPWMGRTPFRPSEDPPIEAPARSTADVEGSTPRPLQATETHTPVTKDGPTTL